MPKTLEELVEARNAAVKRAQEIIANAEAEERDLSEDETKEFDELVKRKGSLDAHITRKRTAESWQEEPDPAGPRLRKPQPESPTETPDERQRPVYALPKRNVRTKNFHGQDAQERAHRAGRFYLACMGHQRSRRWCEERGLHLRKDATPDPEFDSEQRIHQGNVNTTGGYLVPDEIDQDLIDLREQFGVFRQWARVSPMSSDTKSRRRRTGGLTATFVGEASQGTESTKSWDRVNLVAKKIMALATISNELNEDAAINVGDDLSGEIAYAFAEKEDRCGFNGDGTSTFGGIVGVREKLKNLSGTIGDIAGLVVGTGNAYGELVLEDFNKVVSLLPQYADTPNAAWYVHKTFWGQVMQKLLYAAGGNAASDIAGGTPPTFLGYPVRVSQVMPKTEANDQVCALFGDLRLSADFGDRRMTTIMFSEHATVGGVSVFEYDELAVRGTERFDINVHDVGNASATASEREPGPIVGLITAGS